MAVGQGLVINPDWVERAKNGDGHLIEAEIRTSKIPEIALPAKLWNVIRATTGWFNVADDIAEQS